MFGDWNYWQLYGKVTFDGVKKQIIVNADVTTLDIRVDVYSAWIKWLKLGDKDNTRFQQAMRYTGLDVIPGGFTGDSYFLINDWKLLVDLSKVAVSGILFSDNFPTAYYTPGLNAQYPATVSALVNTVTSIQNVVTGTIPSVPSAEQNAAAVWNAQTSAHSSAGSFGEFMSKKLLSVVRFLGLK